MSTTFFLGTRYASPPAKANRRRQPLPLTPYEKVFLAFEDVHKRIQIDGYIYKEKFERLLKEHGLT